VDVDLPKHVVSVVLDGEESCLEFVEQPSIKASHRSVWSYLARAQYCFWSNLFVTVSPLQYYGKTVAAVVLMKLSE